MYPNGYVVWTVGPNPEGLPPEAILFLIFALLLISGLVTFIIGLAQKERARQQYAAYLAQSHLPAEIACEFRRIPAGDSDLMPAGVPI